VVTQKLRQAVMSQSIANNTMFYSIFENFVRSQIQNTLSGVNLPVAAIEHFVVRQEKEQQQQSQQQQQQKEPQVQISSQLNSEVAKSTDSIKSYETATSTLSGTYMDVDETKENKQTKLSETDKSDSGATSSSTCSTKSTLTSVPSNTTSSSSSSVQSWKNIVPADWMPIIEKDIQTQQSQLSATRPFSDAYSSGMPAKRRRILSSKSDLLSVNLFKKVLSRTLEKVQLKPNVSHEQLVEDSVDHSQLIDSFTAEVNSAINERLRSDSDFNEIIRNQKSAKKKSNEDEKVEDDDDEVKNRFLFSKKRFA